MPEAVFHAFVLGLLANLRSVYDIRSQAESGLGRADIIMITKTSRYPAGYLIEFKSIKPGEDIERVAQEALRQREEKQYDASVISAGMIQENARRLAVLLQGKQVFVRE